MKKIIYGLFITVTLFLGIQGVKATDPDLVGNNSSLSGELKCVYKYVEAGYEKTPHIVTVTVKVPGSLTMTYEYNGLKTEASSGAMASAPISSVYKNIHVCAPNGSFNTVTSGADATCNATDIVLTNFVSAEKVKCLPSFKYQIKSTGAGQTKNTTYHYGFGNDLEEDPFYTFDLVEEESSNTISNNIKKVCNFYVQDGLGTANNKKISLFEFKSGTFSATQANPIAWRDNGNLTIQVANGIPKYNTSCADYGTLYTNCHNVKNGTCEITTTNSDGYVKLLIDENQKDYSDIAYGGIADGGMYINYLGQLKVPLSLSSNYNKIQSYELSTRDGKKRINNLAPFYGYDKNGKPYLCMTSDCGGQEYVDNSITKGINNVISYCNDIYKKYSQHKDVYKDRIDECIEFRSFYVEMANKGVIDATESCGLLSPDLTVKIKWVLNIFRIVAPIIAIGLGTVDFIKVIASGDADKEMKNAGKRLLYRLIAAVLLLIIPTIIAFLMDVFLGNSDGYDPDNPFCNIVEWKE